MAASRRTTFLISLLTGSGILHFVRPAPFVSIVPRRLPAKKALVYVSGIAELACAAMLSQPKWRQYGGPAAAVLFAAVFPANVSMALRATGRPVWYRIGSWARLPLQLPLVAWAWRARRDR